MFTLILGECVACEFRIVPMFPSYPVWQLEA